jgi:hypothetical protein
VEFLDTYGTEASGRIHDLLEPRLQALTDRVAGRLLQAWRIVDREVARPPHILERVAAR